MAQQVAQSVSTRAVTVTVTVTGKNGVRGVCFRTVFPRCLRRTLVQGGGTNLEEIPPGCGVPVASQNY